MPHSAGALQLTHRNHSLVGLQASAVSAEGVPAHGPFLLTVTTKLPIFYTYLPQKQAISRCPAQHIQDFSALSQVASFLNEETSGCRCSY
jgi:hypothetical protein